MYRELWERLKQDIEMALDEGRDCGYDDPSNENFDKFWTYERLSKKMKTLEDNVKSKRSK